MQSPKSNPLERQAVCTKQHLHDAPHKKAESLPVEHRANTPNLKKAHDA